MQENPDMPAFPPKTGSEYASPGARGLTKREYFAALALQGILANDTEEVYANPALAAIHFADALLNSLGEGP